jgi:kynurenine formamidase
MTSLTRRLMFGAGALLAATGVKRAQAQTAQPTWSPPPASARCPSPRWGAADRRGAMNLMTAERVKQSAGLIRTGEMVELGHVLSPQMPLNPGRQYSLTSKQTARNPGTNNRWGNEEVVIAEMGQVGTQFDMFPHQTIGNEMYNCVDATANTTRTGHRELGVETVGTIFTRGVLLDIAGLKGVPMLADDYEITVADIEAAMQRQSVQIREGDGVIIHTGYGALWGRENARYVRGNPGLGTAAAEFICARNPILMGADTPPVEVSPSKGGPNLPVHQIALVVNGVHLLENMKLDNMKLDVLATKNRAEFVLILQPLKLQGGTGSTVAPVAIL